MIAGHFVYTQTASRNALPTEILIEKTTPVTCNDGVVPLLTHIKTNRSREWLGTISQEEPPMLLKKALRVWKHGARAGLRPKPFELSCHYLRDLVSPGASPAHTQLPDYLA